MSKTRFLGAAVLFALMASPASAQHMIDEPGNFAFYHPNGDLGIGGSRPAAADAMAMAPPLIMRQPIRMRHAKARK